MTISLHHLFLVLLLLFAFRLAFAMHDERRGPASF